MAFSRRMRLKSHFTKVQTTENDMSSVSDDDPDDSNASIATAYYIYEHAGSPKGEIP